MPVIPGNSQSCFFKETCNSIIDLSSKKGQRKPSSSHSGRKNTVKFKKTVESGVIILTDESGKWRRFTGSNWEQATKKIREHFKANPIEGLTDSAVAGYTHKGNASKGYPAFKKFNG